MRGQREGKHTCIRAPVATASAGGPSPFGRSAIDQSHGNGVSVLCCVTGWRLTIDRLLLVSSAQTMQSKRGEGHSCTHEADAIPCSTSCQPSQRQRPQPSRFAPTPPLMLRPSQACIHPPQLTLQRNCNDDVNSGGGMVRSIWLRRNGWARLAIGCCCCKRVDSSSPALL